ncbi:MAG TPA: recombination protein RecR [Acholeplasmataceae bacterium]|nr:recombination protein RecR [Acholeplasmataceae bacterium]HBY65867.1 recombination protein RecR [Acholeplasmataceae bacterium]
MYPTILKKIIEDFQRLPGIGEKTAERLALHLITQMDNEDIISFSDHLRRLKEEIKYCSVCHMLTDHDICEICNDQTRDHETLMVVADAKDVFIMEKMKTYHGVYHVLGGLVDFSRGVTDKDLNIDTLDKRMKSIKEMIIATNGTVEGEMTAKYLKTLFNDQQVSITRLASGLPVGAELKYADELTLSKAVENRQKY